MSKQLTYTISTAAILAMLPALASAATLSFAEVTQVVGPDPFDPTSVTTINTDSDSANDGTATASTGAFNSVTAEQNADGTSSVSATTGNDGDTELSTATASLTQTQVNNFGVDHDYTIDYSLTGLTTRLFHSSDIGLFANPFTTPVFNNPFESDDETVLIESAYTGATFQYDILVNGVAEFSARADVLVNEAGFTIENQQNFEVTVTDLGFGYLFEVGDIFGTFDIGTFADGETVEVESILTTRAYATNGFDELRNSVGARSTDPVTISSVGQLQSTPTNPTVTPVPLPAAGWMLLAGIGGLAAAGRRKKA